MKATDIRNTAIIGSSVIGSSMATCFAMNGYGVSVIDLQQEALDRAKTFVDKNIAYLEEKGLLTKEEAALALSKVKYTTSYEEGLKDVQFVEESGPEKYEIKKAILREFEKYAAEDAIFASATSGLLMTEIAKDAIHPERCVGAHPYNPPHLIPLIEITKAEKSSDEAVQTAYDFFKLCKKEPIILQKEVLGFVSNRLQMGMIREICHLVMTGVCSVEDIDKAIVFGPGLRWALLGTCMCLELSGAQDGIEGLIHKLEPSWNIWLKDMANWEDFPYDEWPATVQAGVIEEMKNREPEFGNNHDEIIRFRDDALLDLLKLHKKL